MLFKQALKTAELIDAFRVVPRLLLASFLYTTYLTTTWFLSLQVPTTEQAAFCSTIYLSLTGVSGLYQSSGRKWA